MVSGVANITSGSIDVVDNASATGSVASITQSGPFFFILPTSDTLGFKSSGTTEASLTSVQILAYSDDALSFQNGELDGSDRQLVSRKLDNSGFVGEELWVSPTLTGSATWDGATLGIITPSALSGGEVLAEAGSYYRVQADITVNTGAVDLTTVTGLGNEEATYTTTQSIDVTVTSQGAVGFKRSVTVGGPFDIEVTNIQVNKIVTGKL